MLVVAFGLGMALVLAGVGLALVLARGRLDGVDGASPIGRVRGFVPLVASVLVFGLGLYLTVQAVAGTGHALNDRAGTAARIAPVFRSVMDPASGTLGG